MRRYPRQTGGIAAVIFLFGLTAPAVSARPLAQLLIDDPRIYPESITATAAGDLIIGSLGYGTIYRAKPGAEKAQVWIDPVKSGLASVTGVLVDEKTSTLFVCSTPLGAPPERAAELSALRTFDLETGAAKASYAIPDGAKSVCNDITLGPDGTAYVTETIGGRILRLRQGQAALDVWMQDERLKGVDGIAFGEDGSIYVNNVFTSQLFRIMLNDHGEAGTIKALKTSIKLDRPDGMRAIGRHKFLLAEGGAGRISIVTIDGDTAIINPLKTDATGVAGVTLARGRVWTANAKINYFTDPALKDKDPGSFIVYSVDLPRK